MKHIIVSTGNAVGGARRPSVRGRMPLPQAIGRLPQNSTEPCGMSTNPSVSTQRMLSLALRTGMIETLENVAVRNVFSDFKTGFGTKRSQVQILSARLTFPNESPSRPETWESRGLSRCSIAPSPLQHATARGFCIPRNRGFVLPNVTTPRNPIHSPLAPPCGRVTQGRTRVDPPEQLADGRRNRPSNFMDRL